MASSTTVAQAEQMPAESVAWMRGNTGEIRHTAFKHLRILGAVGSLTPAEAELRRRIAEVTGIPRRAASEIIHDVITRFASKRMASAPSAQSLK